MGLFKKTQYFTVSLQNLSENVEDIHKEHPVIPDGMWTKCSHCGKICYVQDILSNYKVCMNCGGYFKLGAYERIEQIVDKGTFKEFNERMISKNPLDFPGYKDKLEEEKRNSNLNEAVVTGIGEINKRLSMICVMDNSFIMGSMGAVVGEKITTAIEMATAKKLPLIIFTTSGGARMQEGIVSLMQMAKTSAALRKHSDEGLLYITVITSPTTGGVTASFASLGDIILAEPKAIIGFAGRRVIEQTIKQKLPDEFQTSEFLLEHGFVDAIIERKALKSTLSNILAIHGY